MQTAPSIFGGRPIFFDHFRGNGETFTGPPWYENTNSDAGFTAVKGATGTVLSMPIANTAGSYLDTMAYRAMAPGAWNIELLFAFIPSTTQENYLGVMVRGDGIIGSAVKSRDQNCQFFEMKIDTSGVAGLQLTRSTAATATNMGNATGSWILSTLSYLRVAAIGTNYYSKAWPSTIGEPSDWHLKIPDPILDGMKNRFGIGWAGGSLGTVIFTTTLCGLWAWDIDTVETDIGLEDVRVATARQRPRLVRV